MSISSFSVVFRCPQAVAIDYLDVEGTATRHALYRYEMILVLSKAGTKKLAQYVTKLRRKYDMNYRLEKLTMPIDMFQVHSESHHLESIHSQQLGTAYDSQ